MNVGTDYHKAKRQAQANADHSGEDWVLHGYGGVWWIGCLSGFTARLPDGAEVISRTAAEGKAERGKGGPS